MMPLFRTQVSPMKRLACYSAGCIMPASYSYEDAVHNVVHACVRHDLFVRQHQHTLEAEVVNLDPRRRY